MITLGTLTQILETRLVALGGRVEKETEIVTVSRDEGNDSIICLLRARGTALNGNQRGRVPREVFIRCEWLIDTDGSEGTALPLVDGFCRYLTFCFSRSRTFLCQPTIDQTGLGRER